MNNIRYLAVTPAPSLGYILNKRCMRLQVYVVVYIHTAELDRGPPHRASRSSPRGLVPPFVRPLAHRTLSYVPLSLVVGDINCSWWRLCLSLVLLHVPTTSIPNRWSSLNYPLTIHYQIGALPDPDIVENAKPMARTKVTILYSRF